MFLLFIPFWGSGLLRVLVEAIQPKCFYHCTHEKWNITKTYIYSAIRNSMKGSYMIPNTKCSNGYTHYVWHEITPIKKEYTFWGEVNLKHSIKWPTFPVHFLTIISRSLKNCFKIFHLGHGIPSCDDFSTHFPLPWHLETNKLAPCMI